MKTSAAILLLWLLAGCADRGEPLSQRVLAKDHAVSFVTFIYTPHGIVPIIHPERWRLYVEQRWTTAETTFDWINVTEEEWRATEVGDLLPAG